MEKEFVKYEQALALKELGFDSKEFISCVFVDTNNIFFESNGFCPNSSIWSPTYSQAFRWFREKYKLKFYIREDIWNHWCSVAMMLDDSEYTDIGEYETYREAELACLAKLIEIAKEKK